jgi:hypothetical protein
MKIVKHHKVRSKTSKQFGIWSGKVLSEIPVGLNKYQVSHGGFNDKIDHIKVGNLSHDCFLWFDDIQEAKEFGLNLIDIAEEQERRLRDESKT